VPGTILEAAGDRLVVACGASEGCRVLRVKPAGKRGMTAAEWLRGRPVAVGDVLRDGP
jgi:methionyl-tRNA formyltransferase